MTLPTSGTISLADIAGEFGGTAPHSLQEYYRGGSLVPATRGALVPAVTGQPEIQTITATGARSNVVTGGTDEQVSIRLRDDFNSGAAVGTYPAITNAVEVTNTNSVTHSVGNSNSWPTGGSVARQGTAGAWTYTAGSGSGSSSSSIAGRLTNTSGGTIDLSSGRVDVEINVTSLPAGGSTDLSLFVDTRNNSNNGFVFLETMRVTETGTYTLSDTSANTNRAVLDDDAYLELRMFESNEARQGFTYTINSVRISSTQEAYDPSTIGPASYSFELDTGGTVFPLATPTLASIGTVDTNSRDTSDILSNRTWDLRNGSSPILASSVSFSSWNDWVDNWLLFDASSAQASIADNIGDNSERVTVTSGSASATFNVTGRLDSGSDEAIQLGSIISQSSTPATSGGISIEGFRNNTTAITGTFTANASATTALTALRTAVLGEWGDDGVTVSSPATVAGTPPNFTVDIADAGLTYPLTSSFTVLSVNFRGINTGPSSTTSTTYNSATELASVFTGTVNGLTFSNSGTVVTVTSTANEPTGDVVLITGSSSNPTQTSLSKTGESGRVGSREIIIDTNQTTNINQMLTITANSGENTEPDLTATVDGTPPAANMVLSTYTVRDYRSREVTTFTRSVSSTSENDLATVLSTIESAVDSNTETPVNFNAGIAGSVLTLTADSNAPLTDTATALDIGITFAEPSGAGTFNFQMTGLVDLSTGVTRSFITGSQSYTDGENLRDILIGLIDADPDLDGIDVSADGSGVFIVVQSSTHRLDGTVTLDSSTSITVTDRTGRGSGGTGATVSTVSGGAATQTAVLWSVSVNHGGGGGSIGFGTASQTQAGQYTQPARDTREDINEGIPTSGIIAFQNFYGGTNA